MALTIDGSDPTGDLGDLLDAKLPIAGGKILQVVRATDTTNRTTTSTSYVDVTGMSVTITPQKSDSTVLVLCVFTMSAEGNGTSVDARLVITNSADTVLTGAQDLIISSPDNLFFPMVLMAQVAPNSTSAQTYKMRFRVTGANRTITIYNGSATGQIYAIEVSA